MGNENTNSETGSGRTKLEVDTPTKELPADLVSLVKAEVARVMHAQVKPVVLEHFQDEEVSHRKFLTSSVTIAATWLGLLLTGVALVLGKTACDAQRNVEYYAERKVDSAIVSLIVERALDGVKGEGQIGLKERIEDSLELEAMRITVKAKKKATEELESEFDILMDKTKDRLNEEARKQSDKLADLVVKQVRKIFDPKDVVKSMHTLPVGSIVAYAGSVPPVGWAICDGKQFSRTSRPELYDVLQQENLPDLRGYFVRGLDTRLDGNPAAIDPNRRLLSEQPDSVGSHSHTFAATGHNQSGTKHAGWFHHDSQEYPKSAETSFAGSRETRPKNVALNYIIKTLSVKPGAPAKPSPP